MNLQSGLEKGIQINNFDEFYKKYNKLILSISNKWYPVLNKLSKGTMDVNDINNELWLHVYNKLSTYDPNKGAKVSSWIYMICESKAGMIKRNLETKKNNLVKNETNMLLNKNIQTNKNNDNNKELELLNIIGIDNTELDRINYQDFLLDYIYSLLEFIDACTVKERKVYLLKIKGKTQIEIAEEAGVSKSYIPKVYKRLSKKFKTLYDSLDEQEYIDKKQRDIITNDIINNKDIFYISNKYNLELETICICKEIINIINIG